MDLQLYGSSTLEAGFFTGIKYYTLGDVGTEKSTIAPIISVINMYRHARQNQCRLRQGQRTFATGINYRAYTDKDVSAQEKTTLFLEVEWGLRAGWI